MSSPSALSAIISSSSGSLPSQTVEDADEDAAADPGGGGALGSGASFTVSGDNRDEIDSGFGREDVVE